MHASMQCLICPTGPLFAGVALARLSPGATAASNVSSHAKLQLCPAMPSLRDSAGMHSAGMPGPHLLLDQALHLLSMLELQLLQSAQVLPLQVSHTLIVLQYLSSRRSL